MGNCCGGLFRSGSSGSAKTLQLNDLSRQRSKREHNWTVTGQIVLRDANLKELPGSIRTVGAAAKVLDASNNRLTSLPAALGELINLHRLVLANNSLSSLGYVEPLQKLKVLVLDSNRLTELPEAVGRLEKLEKLQCAKNILTSLPASLGNLPSLTVLTCGGNKIGELPSSLANATKLELLDASDNYLRSVPESFGNLKRLRSLLLDKNQISTLPGSLLTGCDALQSLSVHSNPITPQELQALEGYEAYEARRRGKVDKQLTGGAATNLDEGIDRKT